MDNMNEKLVRFGDLWYLSSEGTSSQYGDKEKKELELLHDELDAELKIAEVFHNSKFGVYNNDFVNDLRKAEKKITSLKDLMSDSETRSLVDYNGFQDLVREILYE